MLNFPFHVAKVIDGEFCVMFSRESIDCSAAPFKFSIVLKFLRQCPTLDVIRSFIHCHWELVSVVRRPHNVFI